MSDRRDERPLDEIAPDDLVDQLEADVQTVDEAFAWLQRFGDSSTPREERPRCPRCGSVRIGPAPGYADQHASGEQYRYRCKNWHRFDEPLPPLAEVDE